MSFYHIWFLHRFGGIEVPNYENYENVNTSLINYDIFGYFKNSNNKYFVKVNKIDDINFECSICLDNSNLDLCMTKCKHKFHIKCITEWINKKKENIKCPNCNCALT